MIFKLSIRILSMLILVLLSSIFVRAQDNVRRATPPIIDVELSGVEPLPAGVAAEMSFGGAAGGDGEYRDNEDSPYWDRVPASMTHPRKIHGGSLSDFIGCGYRSEQVPELTLSMPSGNQIPVEAISFGTSCWTYAGVDWEYGMELGDYELIAEHPEGGLRYNWTIDYPSYRIVVHLSDINQNPESRLFLLMGFNENEVLNIRFYSNSINPSVDETSGDFTGGYVASRVAQVDETGTVILELATTLSSPVRVDGVAFNIDNYTNMSGPFGPLSTNYELIETALVEQRNQEETLYGVYFPSSIRDAVEASTNIWSGLTFRDMTSPGIQNYQTSLNRNEEGYRIVFNWCADTVERMRQIVAPLTLEFVINDSPITGRNTIRYEEGTCTVWMVFFNALASQLGIQVQYSLSESIFDGVITYQAGEYFHNIDVNFTN